MGACFPVDRVIFLRGPCQSLPGDWPSAKCSTCRFKGIQSEESEFRKGKISTQHVLAKKNKLDELICNEYIELKEKGNTVQALRIPMFFHWKLSIFQNTQVPNRLSKKMGTGAAIQEG